MMLADRSATIIRNSQPGAGGRPVVMYVRPPCRVNLSARATCHPKQATSEQLRSAAVGTSRQAASLALVSAVFQAAKLDNEDVATCFTSRGGCKHGY